MEIPPRRILYRLLRILIAACAMIVYLLPSAVQADVGIQPILPGGSSIKPDAQTPVQMSAEVVSISVRQATEADNELVRLNPKWYGYDTRQVWFVGVAEVAAKFTMKNPTETAVTQTVWFPLASALDNAEWNADLPGEIAPRIEQFQVSVDGKSVDYSVTDLPNPKGADKPPLPWASFEVTFPGATETIIRVSYTMPLQSSVKGHEMALYYIFQTGAGWAGPIGEAELILNLPYPASKETMAGMRNALRLPPYYLPKPGEMPGSPTYNGNQVRWVWRDFEPGPEDDFAVWLIWPSMWKKIETARATVAADPLNGLAWLELAYVYHSLSLSWTHARLLFSDQYLQPCIDAYRKAAELLPEHPAPRVALAFFTIEPYLANHNAPEDVIQYAQRELATAQELDRRDPALMKGAMMSIDDLQMTLSDYFINEATATVNAAALADYLTTETARATVEHATRTAQAIEDAARFALWATSMNCWATAGADCTMTPSPTITATQTPKPALPTTSPPVVTPQPTLTPAMKPDNQVQQIGITAAGLLGLIIFGSLAVRRGKVKE